MRKLLTAVAIALVVTLVIVFNNGEHNQKDYPIHDQRRQKRRNLPGGHGSGGHEQLDDDVHSHKRGDESGDKDDDSTESGDDHDLDDDGGDGGSKRRWKAEYGLAAQYRKELIGRKNTENRAEVLEGILNGSVNLVDLEGVRPSSSSGSYVGVEGLFCKLDFALHKNDPSNHPMFRFMLQKSPDCKSENALMFDLKKVAYLARMRDDQFESSDKGPKVLNLTAVAFHESRCGSTLVANSMIAMDPEKHRAYSESSPPVKAFHMCEDLTSCNKEQAVELLKDTVYLMSRTDDQKEERVFFKFQSATSTRISIFQAAFPEVPWMYIYRDPVQVMMSHVKDDPSMKHSICTKTRRRPPPDIEAIAKRHGRRNAPELEPVEYCAAHLAHLTESAVRNLNGMAIPIDYEQLPSILWEKIMPRIFGRPLEEFEVDNLRKISGIYSKGTNKGKQGEFKSDSEQKEKKASDEVRKAAKEFLSESFAQLARFQPQLLM